MRMLSRIGAVAVLTVLTTSLQVQPASAGSYAYYGHGDAVLVCEATTGTGYGIGGVCIPQLQSGHLQIRDDSELPVGGFWRWIGVPAGTPNREGAFCGSTNVPSPPEGATRLQVWIDGPVSLAVLNGQCLLNAQVGIGTSGFVLFD